MPNDVLQSAPTLVYHRMQICQPLEIHSPNTLPSWQNRRPFLYNTAAGLPAIGQPRCYSIRNVSYFASCFHAECEYIAYLNLTRKAGLAYSICTRC